MFDSILLITVVALTALTMLNWRNIRNESRLRKRHWKSLFGNINSALFDVRSILDRKDGLSEQMHAVHKQGEQNRHEIETLKEDYMKFGSFISELIRLANGGIIKKDGDPSTTDELVRKFFSK